MTVVVLLICKNEYDPFKIESTRVVTTLIHYKSMGIFPNAQGHVTHKSLVGSCQNLNPSEILWVFLLTEKNEEDPIKNEGTRVVTTLFIDFSDAQGQITLKSEMEYCQNSNSSEL